MKNLCFVFALCVMFFFAACSSGSKETVYDDTDSGSQSGEKNDSDNADSATDTTPDNGDSQGDTTPDNGDSQHEGTDSGDTVPDNGDTSKPTDDADSNDTTNQSDTTDSSASNYICKYNPCEGSANSTGDCIPEGTSNYSCKCKENYTWNGSLCAADSKVVSCTDLPKNAHWNTTETITQTWNGNEWIPTNVGTFNTSASSSECYFKCDEHYIWNGTSCSSDTHSANCTGLPDNAIWNSVSDITQSWNGSDWAPTTSATFNETPSTTECRFKCAENYEWKDLQCAAKSREVNCTALPKNAQWNTTETITQKWNGNEWIPTNVGTFDISASSSECRFKCKEHYTWKGSVCSADTQSAACDGLPKNAIWNSVSTITQTWNGSDWYPSTTGTYNTTTSTSECRFKCDEYYYTWNGSFCDAKARETSCTDLPENAQWNITDTITQTWNGNKWIPTNVGSFNTAASSSECRFKCKEHYTWEGSVCSADTQSAVCDGLPPNAIWNSVFTITQTWNGSDWYPPTTGTYNTTASTSECRFKCKENYYWYDSECVSPCDYDDPCEGIAYTTECIATAWNRYICECEGYYSWDGSKCGYQWSTQSSKEKGEDASIYCETLNADGYSDWRLPTLDELRSLVRHCPETFTGGSCPATMGWINPYGSLPESCTRGCSEDGYSYHGKFNWGETWSDTGTKYGGMAWSQSHYTVNFKDGSLDTWNNSSSFYIHCIRER